jgi:tetratricopeptide (TPR) repeat protein
MNQVELTFQYQAKPVHPVQAWMIHTGSSEAWLAEITSWRVKQASLRILPIPRTKEHRETFAAIVYHLDSSPIERPQDSKVDCVPYASLAGQLWIPTNALPCPALTQRELDSLLNSDYQYVWHPQIGMIAYELHEILQLTDLLQAPLDHTVNWNCAIDGLAFSDRLQSIRPESPPSVEIIFQQGSDGIGGQSDELNQLPPSPNEINGPLGNLGHKALFGMAQMIQNMAHWAQNPNQDPNNSDPGGDSNQSYQLFQGGGAAGGGMFANFLSAIGGWAGQQMQSIQEGLEAARQKEIARLLNMLENNPDLGLKYAIPMGGDEHRGIAMPGASLSPGNINFNLSNLGGGGPADYWDISPEYQYQLQKRYRELAERELSLKRYRRAAYIYSQLLNEHHSAAEALVQGNFWREAAILYRDRLENKQQAAACFEAGGLWSEAIELYTLLNDHEKIGDIYTQLEQFEKAKEEYETALNLKMYRDDYLDAFRLAENKLNQPDRATSLLEEAWEIESSQSERCLTKLFERLGEQGDHERTQTLLENFQTEKSLIRFDFKRHLQAPLAKILVSVAQTYPDRVIQARSADCTRVLISNWLKQSEYSKREVFTRQLQKLVPEDRLLHRDCARFAEQRSKKEKPVYQLVEESVTGTLQEISSFTVERNVQIQRACQNKGMIYVLGIYDTTEKPFVTRFSHTGDVENAGIAFMAQEIVEADQFFCTTGKDLYLSLLKPSGRRKHFAERSHPQAPFVQIKEFVTELGVFRTPLEHGDGYYELRERGDHLEVLTVNDAGRSHKLIYAQGIISEENWYHPVCAMVATESSLIFAKDDQLYRYVFGDNQFSPFIKCFSSVREIVSPYSDREGFKRDHHTMIITRDYGGIVIWNGFLGNQYTTFARDMPHPKVCILKNGLMISVSSGICEIYRIEDQKIVLIGEDKLRSREVVQVFACPKQDEFLVIFADGIVKRYRASVV